MEYKGTNIYVFKRNIHGDIYFAASSDGYESIGIGESSEEAIECFKELLDKELEELKNEKQ